MPISDEELRLIKPFTFSYSGHKIGPDWPAPPLEDIAISLGRITRFAGHGARFYSVLIHSMVTADLVSKEVKPLCLLHDSSEIIYSDVPSPHKPTAIKNGEKKVLNTIFSTYLSPELYKKHKSDDSLWKLVKIADSEAFLGEVHVLGNRAMRDMYSERSKKAEKLVRKYLNKYKDEDCLRPDGLAVLDFIHRVKDAQE